MTVNVSNKKTFHHPRRHFFKKFLSIPNYRNLDRRPRCERFQSSSSRVSSILATRADRGKGRGAEVCINVKKEKKKEEKKRKALLFACTPFCRTPGTARELTVHTVYPGHTRDAHNSKTHTLGDDGIYIYI